MNAGSATFESLVSRWGGEEVVVRFDSTSSSWIIIAIHSTALGPAVGGTRMKSYGSFAEAAGDALHLAAGMTLKFAVAGFPRGGGKSVIATPPGIAGEPRQALLGRYAELLRDLGMFTTGPDVGTSSADMDLIAEIAPGRAFSRTVANGGAGNSAPPTALGVLTAIEAAWSVVTDGAPLREASVLVQGAGSVGGLLIERLLAAGADVRFSDVDRRAIEHWTERGLRHVEPRDVASHPVDILAPCALGGVLDRDTIAQLCCRVVAGAANNQLAEAEDADRLRARGILYVPDFVANFGGAVAITGQEALGWNAAEAAAAVRDIGRIVREIAGRAEREGISTYEAARRIAESRLQQARSRFDAR